MNERIKQLAEQAKKHALDAMIKITDKEQALKVYSESYDTEFAELIVKECSKVIRHGGQRKGAFGNEDLRPSEIATMIEEHFGVEE